MINIGIIIGSTRPARKGEQVAEWVRAAGSARTDAAFETVDLRDHPLPHLDEALPAMSGRYENEHTLAWRDRIAAFDGFVIVTPEYNGGTSAVLKNALDFLFAEWTDKPVGLVSYGVNGGGRAADYLRLTCGIMGMAVVGPQVGLPLSTAFGGDGFAPGERSGMMLGLLLDKVVAWSAALAAVRAVPAGA